MIYITENMHGTTVMCKPENVPKYRLAMQKASKARKPRLSAAKEARKFPELAAGMSTRGYVLAYEGANTQQGFGRTDFECPNYLHTPTMPDPAPIEEAWQDESAE